MSSKLLFLSAASALVIGFSATSRAEVEVDFSVLNSLPSSTALPANDGPLFPVVKKSAVRKAKPAPKKVVKVEEPKPAEPKVEVVVDDSPVVVPEKTPEIVPEVEPIPSTIEEVPFKTEEAPAPEEAPTAAPVPEEVTSEEIPATTPVEEETATPVEESILNPTPLVPADVSAPTEEVENSAGTITSPSKIVFAADEIELTQADKDIVDSIVSSFQDAKSNKIGIISYNYEDGQDSFKKKRQSLNRAIEIRTYLLGKGFKNFSIKVINTDASAKQNTVEIEEVK